MLNTRDPVGIPAVLRLVVALVMGMLTPSLSVLRPMPDVLDIL